MVGAYYAMKHVKCLSCRGARQALIMRRNRQVPSYTKYDCENAPPESKEPESKEPASKITGKQGNLQARQPKSKLSCKQGDPKAR